MSIDAVSLVYLAHQVYSDAALAVAREKCVAALRLTNKALRYLQVAASDATLVASLLLDLFEKITNHEPQHDVAWTGHLLFSGCGALSRSRILGYSKPWCASAPTSSSVVLPAGLQRPRVDCTSSSCWTVPEYWRSKVATIGSDGSLCQYPERYPQMPIVHY